MCIFGAVIMLCMREVGVSCRTARDPDMLVHCNASIRAYEPGIVRSKASNCFRKVFVSASAPVADTDTYTWTGNDEFSSLDDRKDLPPLPLPPIRNRRRIVLVRHGQSTWNAEGRIQGSSNFSCLTAKGTAQAETTRDMVSTLTPGLLMAVVS